MGEIIAGLVALVVTLIGLYLKLMGAIRENQREFHEHIDKCGNKLRDEMVDLSSDLRADIQDIRLGYVQKAEMTGVWQELHSLREQMKKIGENVAILVDRATRNE